MKKYLYILFMLVLMIPINVSAIASNASVSSNLTYDQCVNFQDALTSSSGSGFLGHCVKATCYGGSWETQFLLSKRLVSCTNGNTNPYYRTNSDGCSPYTGSCNPTTDVKYCSMVMYYDCAKNGDGTAYNAPTTAQITKATTKATTRGTTKKKTTTSTTTTTTTTAVPKSNNNYLNSIKLSEGKIKFNKDALEYTIEIGEDVKTIKVTAVAEDRLATVIVTGNEEINVANPIKIIVTAENGEIKEYVINLKIKEKEPDSNALLKSITIKSHKISFDPEVFSYNVKISKDTKALTIEAKTESKTSKYEITGNANLKNNSKIKITVTAENGNTEEYLINVKYKSNIGIIIIIILIVGVIGYVGFKLVRNLIPNKEDDNYDYE